MELLQTTKAFDAHPAHVQDKIRATFSQAEEKYNVKFLMIADMANQAYEFTIADSSSDRFEYAPKGIYVRSPDWYAGADVKAKRSDGLYLGSIEDGPQFENKHFQASAVNLSRIAHSFKKKKRLMGMSLGEGDDVNRNVRNVVDLMLSPHIYAVNAEFKADFDDLIDRTYRPIDICDTTWGYMMYPTVSFMPQHRKAVEAGTLVEVPIPNYLNVCRCALRMQWMRENGSIHSPQRLTDLLEVLSVPETVKTCVTGLLDHYRNSTEGKIMMGVEPETIKYMHGEMHKWIDFDECVQQQIDAEADKAFNAAAGREAGKVLKKWIAQALA